MIGGFSLLILVGGCSGATSFDAPTVANGTAIAAGDRSSASTGAAHPARRLSWEYPEFERDKS
jgi:hypothetical protein